ncbi:hemin uptake protein HemP [Arthrospira platensis SPKY1]|nr:hemin uptake protein HemP [Arthrospira platensis SPKY1]
MPAQDSACRESQHAAHETAGQPLLERNGEGAAIRSERLFAGRNTLAIEHEGCRYILRATRSGKLILTK